METEGQPGTEVTHALLDQGSTVTMIGQKLVEKISADVPVDELHLQGLNGSYDNSSKKVELKIRGVHIVHVARSKDSI